MIDRFYVEDLLSFKSVELELSQGLILFSGPSGAGKSVLMDSILAIFGLKDPIGAKSEISYTSYEDVEEFDINSGEEVVLKHIKKDKTRYFLNSSQISKKSLQRYFKYHIRHLNTKDKSDFESQNILNIIDSIASNEIADFDTLLDGYIGDFQELSNTTTKLNKIKEDEAKIEELKEFTKFEIQKIENLNPQDGEYEELQYIKKQLSKKDKIDEALESSKNIFNFTSDVNRALELLEVDCGFFDEAMNELENQFEKANDFLSGLDDIDIETTLDRIEELSNLIKRFGSVKDAIEYKEEKVKELDGYENLSFEKLKLEKSVIKLEKIVIEKSQRLSKYRKEIAKRLNEKIDYYLKFLELDGSRLNFIDTKPTINGSDEIELELSGVSLDKISSGEFNRLRLALLASSSELENSNSSKGILFLDEIDANLSGKESGSVAKVLLQLSKSYQIFAISHQPQLTSKAHIHIFVDKKDGKSSAKILNNDERVHEIARIISSDNITDEALNFARELVG
jgi:DNA repair protein RecN (Recombination protein N)